MCDMCLFCVMSANYQYSHTHTLFLTHTHAHTHTRAFLNCVHVWNLCSCDVCLYEESVFV